MSDSSTITRGSSSEPARLPRAVRDIFHTAQDAAERGIATPALSAEVRSVNAFVTEEAAEIVRACYLMAGTTGLRAGPLERAFRDIHAGTQHAMVNPQHHVEWARSLSTSPSDD